MKKMITLILVLVLLLSLTACGNATTSSSTTDSSTASSSTTKEPTNTEPSDKPITFSLYIDHPWFWVDKWGNDDVSKEITKRTGVSFDITRSTDYSQLALLIAANDLTDMVYTQMGDMMALLSDPNVSYSYNELVDKTGVDINATDLQIKMNTFTDGNYYRLLNAYPRKEDLESENGMMGGGVKSIAYRTDIYKEIGSPEIKTLEDLENALVAAKTLHPDIIPLLNTVGSEWYFAEQLGLNGSNPIGYNSNNEPCYMLSMDGIKDYFALLNRFARKGLIVEEAQTYNTDRYIEVRNSGKSFMLLRTGDEALTANRAAKEAKSGYTWKLLTNDLSDDALVGVNTNVGWCGTFITKKCPDPERAIKFMSFMRSDEGRKLAAWGIQKEHWDFNDKGQTVLLDNYKKGISDGKSKEKDFGIGMWIFGDLGDENTFIDYSSTDPDLNDFTERRKTAAKHTALMPELSFAFPTGGDEARIFNSLQDMYKSEFLKIVFAKTDEEFNKAVENMYKQAEQIGIDKLEDWMKKTVAERS